MPGNRANLVIYVLSASSLSGQEGLHGSPEYQGCTLMYTFVSLFCISHYIAVSCQIKPLTTALQNSLSSFEIESFPFNVKIKLLCLIL